MSSEINKEVKVEEVKVEEVKPEELFNPDVIEEIETVLTEEIADNSGNEEYNEEV